MYEYDKNFYQYINRGATDSAGVVLPVLLSVLQEPVDSVLDVGCGAGAWLKVWKSLGVRIFGLDGSYVGAEQLLIEPEEFSPADLSAGFDLQQRFGIVQSLEVAEHLPPESSEKFVECLCRHSDMVLFSSAPPGQGGENHINEQPYDYWRQLFRNQGYEMYDPVRPSVLSNRQVKPWYRYNTFLYVSSRLRADLGTGLTSCRVDPGEPVVDLSPPAYKLRKSLVALLPVSVRTALAIIKKGVFRYSMKATVYWKQAAPCRTDH